MRPETSRLQRMMVPSKVQGTMSTSTDMVEKQKALIFGETGLLNALDKQIEKTGGYICGQSMTVVDLLIYCEIATLLTLLKI